MLPKRRNNVVQGVYAKKGTNPANQWTGVISVDEMPYTLNPEKGYIVNTNNVIGPPSQNPYGVGYAYSMSHRTLRISELLETLIANSTTHPIRVRDI